MCVIHALRSCAFPVAVRHLRRAGCGVVYWLCRGRWWTFAAFSLGHKKRRPNGRLFFCLEKGLLSDSDVCYLTVLHIFVGSVDARDGLQQVVVFELTTEVKAFQSGRIKTGEQHIENDKDVDGHILLEVLDNLFACLLVLRVMEDKSGLHIQSVLACLIQFILNFIEIFVKFSVSSHIERYPGNFTV